VEVMHISQLLERLVLEKKLNFKKEIPLSVTYHDPCHLGRMSEPFTADWIHESKLKRPMQMKRQGWFGIYDPPRKVLTAIPGVELTEMERIREWSWCCGAGGGVMEAYPEFAEDTAVERIGEAKATGAEALVTACPWCLRKFRDTVAQTGDTIKIYDLIDLALISAEA
ncbi:MAG: heterodisulfide reductase-related iron-sulfur binding cluster, partial [Methanomicrobiales archaeon]